MHHQPPVAIISTYGMIVNTSVTTPLYSELIEGAIMDFGAWLSEKLEDHGWSGAELARRMRISPAAVNKWVNNKTRPSRPQIPVLATILGVSSNELWELIEGRHAPREITEIVARELPETMTPDEARLVAHLLRSLVAGLRDWNKEEDARDEAQIAGDHQSNVVSVLPVQRLLAVEDPERVPE